MLRDGLGMLAQVTAMINSLFTDTGDDDDDGTDEGVDSSVLPRLICNPKATEYERRMVGH